MINDCDAAVVAIELLVLATFQSFVDIFVLCVSLSVFELDASIVPAKMRPTRPNDVILCILMASVSIIRNGCVDRCGAKTPSTELFCNIEGFNKFEKKRKKNG